MNWVYKWYDPKRMPEPLQLGNEIATMLLCALPGSSGLPPSAISPVGPGLAPEMHTP